MRSNVVITHIKNTPCLCYSIRCYIIFHYSTMAVHMFKRRYYIQLPLPTLYHLKYETLHFMCSNQRCLVITYSSSIAFFFTVVTVHLVLSFDFYRFENCFHPLCLKNAFMTYKSNMTSAFTVHLCLIHLMEQFCECCVKSCTSLYHTIDLTVRIHQWKRQTPKWLLSVCLCATHQAFIAVHQVSLKNLKSTDTNSIMFADPSLKAGCVVMVMSLPVKLQDVCYLKSSPSIQQHHVAHTLQGVVLSAYQIYGSLLEGYSQYIVSFFRKLH